MNARRDPRLIDPKTGRVMSKYTTKLCRHCDTRHPDAEVRWERGFWECADKKACSSRGVEVPHPTEYQDAERFDASLEQRHIICSCGAKYWWPLWLNKLPKPPNGDEQEGSDEEGNPTVLLLRNCVWCRSTMSHPKEA